MEVTISSYYGPLPFTRDQIADWLRQNELVETAADWLYHISSRFYAQHSEPVTVSGDDEHLWIGLAP